MTISKAELYAFLRQHETGVIASVAPDGCPQAARVYLAATRELELVFYTLQTNRKCLNLRQDPHIAAVMGFEGRQTVQYEGLADEVRDEEREDIKAIFAEALPNRSAQLDWPGLTLFRVKPIWIRFSEYGQSWRVDEMMFPENKPHEEVRQPFFRRLFMPGNFARRGGGSRRDHES